MTSPSDTFDEHTIRCASCRTGLTFPHADSERMRKYATGLGWWWEGSTIQCPTCRACNNTASAFVPQ